ncbi:MAG: hypothetical protein KJ066_07315 [Acidobacteria bacterium]|nr:hypothetical protein [Acidobacteriota bacterium]
MRLRDTILGLVVVGVLVAGMLWTRARSHQGGSGGPSSTTGPAAGWAAEAAIPDVTLADGVVDLDEVRVVLSVAPRPPVAFEKKQFRVRTESHGRPVVPEGGRISFEMVMPMGDHRYTLVPAGDGWVEAEVVLPFCKSGNPRWFAIVEGTVGGRDITARFRLDLARRGAAPTP